MGDIPVPPKYTSADFLKQDYWRLRGKLDVPKERWISYPHLQTESDPSLVVGWAGWNHLQQATALVSYYDARRREGWDAKRLTPILAGLDQLLPWIHQWHPEIDPEFGDTAGQSYQTMLEHDAHELGLTIEEIRNWEPPKKARKRHRQEDDEVDRRSQGDHRLNGVGASIHRLRVTMNVKRRYAHGESQRRLSASRSQGHRESQADRDTGHRLGRKER